MNDTILLEKKLNILLTAYETATDLEEKLNAKQLYNMLLQELLKSDSDKKEYYVSMLKDEPLKIERVRRIHNKSLVDDIKRKIIKAYLIDYDIDLEENNEEILNKFYFNIKENLLKGTNDGSIDKEYIKNRLTSIMLDTKVVKKFDKKFDSNIEYEKDYQDGDDLIKKGLGKC